MRAPLSCPMVPRHGDGARTASRRVGQRAGQPLGDPRRRQGGDEHGVRAVDGPPLLLVQAHRDLGHVARGRGCRRSGWSGRPAHRHRRRRCPRSTPCPSAWCTAPSAYERSVTGAEHLPGPHVDLDAATRSGRRARARRGRSRPRAPPTWHLTTARRQRRRVRARPARPAPRPNPRPAGRATRAARRRRPPRRRTPGQRACTVAASGSRSAEPARAAHPDDDRSRRAAARRPGAGAWARAAPRPRAATGRGRPRRCRRPAAWARSGTGLRRLPPKAPPLASGDAGAIRPAPAGVRLDVGGLDPGRLQREGPVAPGHLDGVRQRHRAVAALDASAAGPGGADPGGERRVGAELDERTGRRRVVGEAAPAEDHLGSRALEGRPLDLGAPGRQHRVAADRRPARPWPRRY